MGPMNADVVSGFGTWRFEIEAERAFSILGTLWCTCITGNRSLDDIDELSAAGFGCNTSRYVPTVYIDLPKSSHPLHLTMTDCFRLDLLAANTGIAAK